MGLGLLVIEFDVQIFVVCLAVFRATRFVIKDHILNSLRNRLFDRFPPESTRLGYLFTCPWCIGFWLSLIAYFCYTISPLPTLWVCYVLAISAVVGWLTALDDRI